jgi:hypothetical protein
MAEGKSISNQDALRPSAQIVTALRMILSPGQVTELRALDAVLQGDRRPQVVSGYFDDPAKLAKAAESIASAKGAYFVVNPVNPALLARATNRIRAAGKEPLTSDADVICRRWLPIDTDPVRPSGISSSDAEHGSSLERVRLIRDSLAFAGLAYPHPGRLRQRRPPSVRS